MIFSIGECYSPFIFTTQPTPKILCIFFHMFLLDWIMKWNWNYFHLTLIWDLIHSLNWRSMSSKVDHQTRPIKLYIPNTWLQRRYLYILIKPWEIKVISFMTKSRIYFFIWSFIQKLILSSICKYTLFNSNRIQLKNLVDNKYIILFVRKLFGTSFVWWRPFINIAWFIVWRCILHS